MAEEVDTHERLRIAAEFGNRLAMQILNELQTRDEVGQQGAEKYWRTRLVAEKREIAEVLDILEERS